MGLWPRIFLLSLAAGLVFQGQGCAGSRCPPLWTHYQGNCYRHFGGRVTWHEANRLCREQGSELVSVHSDGENSLINELFRSGTDLSCVYPIQGYWMGLNDHSSEGNFVYADGSNVDFANWLPGQPDNAGGNENCGHVWYHDPTNNVNAHGWNDWVCGQTLAYVCKMDSITTCDASRDSTADIIQIECRSSSLECDELLPIARAQLNMTNLILRELDEMRNNTPTCICIPNADPITNPPLPTQRPRDCKEVQTAGFNASGRYAVYPDDGEDPFFVFCDMETDGGGWTVFQRRQDGSVDFYRNWADYKYGFGSVVGEHWLGNEKIHRLTSQKTYELRIDLEDFEENTRYAAYNQFRLTEEALFYKLILGEYNGDANDSLRFHAGMKFSTKDRDLDESGTNCAEVYHGAWWYNVCHYSNLNGDYLAGTTTSHATGVVWYHWKGYEYSLKKTEMKIRPN